MPDCIISLGFIDKKLLIPLFYIILYCFINIYEEHIADDSGKYDIAIFYTEGFGIKISDAMIFFIANKFRYSSSQKKNNIIKKQNYIKDFSILFLLTVFYTATDLSLLFLIHEEDTKTYSARELYINYAIELIIISLSTYLILKYKYYKHHILSIAIIVILCIITDILLKNFIHTNFSVVISSIVGVLGDCIIYTYFKFLIDHKYYYYLDILYIYGIFGFICYLLSFIIIIIIHSVNESYAIFKEFYDFYSEKGVFHIILRFIIFGLLLQGFCADILEFLILDKLTPNYIIIGFEIGMIPSNLIGNEGSDRLLVSIISVLQLLSLLFI